MQLDQASTAVTDQQRLEGTIAAKRGEAGRSGSTSSGAASVKLAARVGR